MTWEEIAFPFMEYGRFIVLEGIDGSGTTTGQHRIAAAISNLDKRYTVTLSREPSGGPIGQIIRQALRGEIKIEDPQAIAALFLVDRYEHLPRDVLPAIKGGGIVLQDRYWYSSLCYQSTSGVDAQEIIKSHRKMPIPDLVLVYDLSAKVAESRRKQRDGSEELFDQFDFQERLVEKYRQLPSLFPDHPIHLIDASKSVDEVVEEAMRIITPKLPYYQIPMLKAL